MGRLMKTGDRMDAVLWISALIGLGCAVALAAGLAFLARQPATAPAPGTDDSLSLLFEGDRLADADNALWPLLRDCPHRPGWAEVQQALDPIIPGLPGALPNSASVFHGDAVTTQFMPTQDGCRISISPTREGAIDWFEARRNAVAVRRMQPALMRAPDPIWNTDMDGGFIWGNDAFAAFAETHGSPQAFAAHVSGLLAKPDPLRSKRIELSKPGQHHKRWFEVTTRETDAGLLFFASSVDAVVSAEEAQRNFVQTLSKTFANLTTGLAIFDRHRRLALFNPALIDLSGVSVDFLSSRPALFEFFDKLREKQIMPEPKNYDDWRERMAKLVAAASDDRFRETWNLAGGQTFDVTGRPYPDGAIAFLFNDITAEVSLTRGFRTELDTMQSMLDAMEDTVAVFNQQGVLTVCNAAYKQMWNVDPDTSISESTIMDATQEWKSAFHPSPVWAELRDFVTSTTERASWDTDLRSKDGREVTCRIDPICYGATLIRFCHKPRPSDAGSEKDALQIVSA